MRGAGRDATKLFMEMHEYVNFEYLLKACKVGTLVKKRTPMKISADSNTLPQNQGIFRLHSSFLKDQSKVLKKTLQK